MKTKTAPSCSTATLAKKLGFKPGTRAVAIDAPPDYQKWLAPLPEGVVFATAVDADTEIVHLFATVTADLKERLVDLRYQIKPDAAVWVSWPKKSAKVPTDITENTIREIALPLGFVDIKVCAVSEVWSGLKLVIRTALRSPP